jgi:cellobiose-specific phosphotransferase system component IIC
MTIILKFCIGSWDDVHFIVTVIILAAQCFLWLPNTRVANCQDRESTLTLPDEFVITSIGL